jgi:hypothetical protein
MSLWWQIMNDILPSSALVGKFIWTWAELAQLSLFPTRPGRPKQTRPEKYPNSLLQLYLFSFTAGKLKMEDDLKFLCKCKTTSIFSLEWKTTYICSNGRWTQFFLMEDNLNVLYKWKTTTSSSNLRWSYFFLNGRLPQYLYKWKMTNFLQNRNKDFSQEKYGR